MPTMISETQAAEASPISSDHQFHVQPNNENITQTPKMSLYELSREERIKENLQRMQQLGLKDLSNSLLKSSSQTQRCGSGRPKGSKSTATPSPPISPPSGAVRRSSRLFRLQNATPVSYSEVVFTKKDELLVDVDLELKGTKVYKRGGRIYDPVNGKTCHQCRQKTLEDHTHCSKCNKVQGQFCRACLYTRYGEHVPEANENPNWVCPVCRGICNCSLCRKAKGWAPTGYLYKKISQMGFKSVAHYLIQTQRVQTNIEKNPDSINQVSAKRSLSFPALELPSQGSSDVDDSQPVISKSLSGEDGLNIEKKENDYLEPNPTARKSLLFSTSGAEFEKGESMKINLDVHGQLGFSDLDSGKERDDGLKCDHEKESHFTEKESNGNSLGLACCTKPEENHAFIIEPNTESIAARLRQGHGEDQNSNDWMEGVNDKVLDVKQTVNHEVSGTTLVQEKEMHGANDNKGEGYIASESRPKLKKQPASAMDQSPDSIAARMKQRRRQSKDQEEHGLSVANESKSDSKVAENASSGIESEVKKEMHEANDNTGEGYIASKSSPKLKKQAVSATDQSPDSVAARMKQRRRQSKDQEEHELSVKESEVKKEMHEANDNKGEGYIASESSPKLKKQDASAMDQTPDSVAARMKQRRRQSKDREEHELSVAYESKSDSKVAENALSGKEPEVKKEMHNANDNKGEGYIASETSPKLKKRLASAMEHSPDSIAARMKQRRRQAKDN
ncbi:hypothetical protein CCACVL1_26283 [Corchorus capsularis]|uniref:RING-type domain-containing protein n=1 Tax=Corchorus capsularis TaxID=210143 RepID=A0A1R3GFC1_COCAP|nr:hypothetical protein CCACVL1_26283 [Corchorus capsularis]